MIGYAFLKTDLWMIGLATVLMTLFVGVSGWAFVLFFITALWCPMGLYCGFYLNNHYRYSRGRIVQLSKGNECFYYSIGGAVRRYEKANLKSVVIRKTQHHRSPIAEGISFAKLCFTNGEVLIIPQMLLRGADLEMKFAGCPVIVRRGGLYIRKKDLLPE